MNQETKYQIEDAIQKAADLKETIAQDDKKRLKIDIIIATIRASSDIVELINNGNYDGVFDRTVALKNEISFIKSKLRHPVFPKGGHIYPNKSEGEFVILKAKK